LVSASRALLALSASISTLESAGPSRRIETSTRPRRSRRRTICSAQTEESPSDSGRRTRTSRVRAFTERTSTTTRPARLEREAVP